MTRGRPRKSRRPWAAGLLAVVTASTGCRGEARSGTVDSHLAATPTRDNVASMVDALTALQLSAAPAGIMARDSTWRVMIDTTGAPQVFLIRTVAALVLPDGPFELLAPLTYFQFKNGQWVQSTQDRGGLVVPPSVHAELVTDFEDPDRIYFFRARSVVLSSADTNGGALTAQMRSLVEAMTQEVAKWLSAGFIGADAAP